MTTLRENFRKALVEGNARNLTRIVDRIWMKHRLDHEEIFDIAQRLVPSLTPDRFAQLLDDGDRELHSLM